MTKKEEQKKEDFNCFTIVMKFPLTIDVYKRQVLEREVRRLIVFSLLFEGGYLSFRSVRLKNETIVNT